MKENSVSGRYAKALYLLSEKQAAREGASFVEPARSHARGPALPRGAWWLRGRASATSSPIPVSRRRIGGACSRAGSRGGRCAPSRCSATCCSARSASASWARSQRHSSLLAEKAKGLQRVQVVSAVALSAAELERLHREPRAHDGQEDHDDDAGGSVARRRRLRANRRPDRGPQRDHAAPGHRQPALRSQRLVTRHTITTTNRGSHPCLSDRKK